MFCKNRTAFNLVKEQCVTRVAREVVTKSVSSFIFIMEKRNSHFRNNRFYERHGVMPFNEFSI